VSTVADQATTPTDREDPTVATAAPICQTTGRRKRAVARVRIRPGEGAITVNGHAFEDYFTSATHRMIVTEPLRLTDTSESWAIDVTIDGGGVSGQAGAFRLGIARALCQLDPELRAALKRAGFLTRDSREKESKKYGLKKARKAPQYSKR
jgi:small subunit ribosomal protein S9